MARNLHKGQKDDASARTPAVERRAGQRVRASIPVTWRYPRLASGFDQSVQAVIVDVSISGARVMAPTSRDLTVGTVVELVLPDGSTGLGIVRRFEVGAVPGRGFFGIEFGTIDDAFRGYVFRTVSDALRRTGE